MSANTDSYRTTMGYRVEYMKDGAWMTLTKAGPGQNGKDYANERADELAAKSPETRVRVVIVEESMRVLREYNAPAPGSLGGAVGGGACGWG